MVPKKVGGEDNGVFTKADVPGEYRLIIRGEGKGPDGGEVKAEATARLSCTTRTRN